MCVIDLPSRKPNQEEIVLINKYLRDIEKPYGLCLLLILSIISSQSRGMIQAFMIFLMVSVFVLVVIHGIYKLLTESYEIVDIDLKVSANNKVTYTLNGVDHEVKSVVGEYTGDSAVLVKTDKCKYIAILK